MYRIGVTPVRFALSAASGAGNGRRSRGVVANRAGSRHPSTVGLAVLTGVALVFNATLAALLAGGLCGLGLVGLAAGLQVAALERKLGGRLLFERGGRGARLFLER